jgi:hypothetical protein
MALFTDIEIIGAQDLLPYESSLLQVASAHSINVDQKIALAKRDVGEKLMLFLQDAGVSDPQWLSRLVIGLSTVVVTPPLKRWLCLEALTKFFAEAYNIQLNTRFHAKWQEYLQDTKVAADQALHAGLGIVYSPLPKPQLPEVSVQAGVAPQEPLYVQTTWLNSQGAESAPSPVNGLVANAQSGISVQMAEGALKSPPAAFGWNVYLGSNEAIITLQNGNPLSIGSTWSLPASGIVSGSKSGDGQKPDFIIPISRQIRRG